jgi:hypothetical protein
MPPAEVTVTGPGDRKQTLPVVDWPFVYHQTRTPGIYTVTAGKQTVPYAIQPAAEEFTLTPVTASEQKKIQEQVALTFENSSAVIGRAVLDPDKKRDLWWLLLVAVVLFLCVEIWMTRRMVKARS